MKWNPEHGVGTSKKVLFSIQLFYFAFISFPHCMPDGLEADTEKQVKCHDLIGKKYQATSLSHWRNINIPLFTHGSTVSWTGKVEKQN